ncbi:aminoglycoside N(3)-acetyltransferase [Streptomyces sp. H39-S7]|uniref:aminoglycoside N(3)-acetyltransferase n=1 Tax=Streptomyces sp. H39-S7 TaxID=3004357 RepID=UPI0022AFC38D|nr:AAC(3) family N-acetyltransferase [Streptomyces sp. H39-S7]MCZ4122281.1 AAC(3) family N-acetyltransferase [Streptomyces sp. H39-S7]
MAEAAGLAKRFAALGVRRGGVLLVHASLGGSGLRDTEVRDALLDVLGPSGTLVVPAFTPENSDSSRAHRRAVAGLNDRDRAVFRTAMPPFEPDATGCLSMGVLAERVRTTPGAVRSGHPQTSFAALGPRAADLLAGHHPHCHLGERSPLSRLYAAGAQVLLLRVGFEVCSAFHLAEYRRSPPPALRTYRCVMESKGNWIAYRDAVLDDSDFGAIGAELSLDLLAEQEVAGRPALLIGMKEAVDHALAIMSGFRR